MDLKDDSLPLTSPSRTQIYPFTVPLTPAQPICMDTGYFPLLLTAIFIIFIYFISPCC